MAQKNMKLEKKEEKVHKDLDGDREKGEPAAHKAKVLGGKNAVSSSFDKSGKKESTRGGVKKGKCTCPPGKPCTCGKR